MGGEFDKRSKFSEAQIAFVLRQAEEGTSVEEVCRKIVRPRKRDRLRNAGHAGETLTAYEPVSLASFV